MIKSMTGFGRSEIVKGNRKISVEIKSVNHRYLEAGIKMPKKLNVFESRMRDLLKKYATRGKIDIFINYEDDSESQVNLKFNQNIADEYMAIFNNMSEKYNLKNRFVIGNIGRLESQKNQLFLVDIFNELHKKEQKFFLIIIGDGHLKEKLTASIKKYGLDNDALVLGSDEVGIKEECAKFYSLFDAFVLPSIYEGLPVVGVEAQLASLHCFFSENVTRDVDFSNNATFISLDEGAKEWANKILPTIANIRKKVYSEKYDINIQSDRLKEIYKSILQGSIRI